MELSINNEIKKTLLMWVRLNLAEKLELDIGYSESDLDFNNKIYNEKYGAFVTLKIADKLRGCIGYIEGIDNLKNTIKEMSISAAFRDPRFSSLSVSEFENINIEISILSPIVKVVDISNINVGSDGLIVTKGIRRGLLLPQVATEYKWTLEEFLSHTCLKAGLNKDIWREKGVIIEKFTAYVFSETDIK